MGYSITFSGELYHHGIKGQKWGVRRYQNPDGTYTSEGKARRNGGLSEEELAARKEHTRKVVKGVATGVLVAGTVAAAAVFYKNHKSEINDAANKALDKLNNPEPENKNDFRFGQKGKKGSEPALDMNKEYARWMNLGPDAKPEDIMKLYDDSPYAKKEKTGREVVANWLVNAMANQKVAGHRAGQMAKNAVGNFKNGVKEGIENAPKEAGKKVATVVITGTAMLALKSMLDDSVGKETAAKMLQANNNKKVSSYWKVSPEDKDDE